VQVQGLGCAAGWPRGSGRAAPVSGADRGARARGGAAVVDRARIWLVLQLGVPVAGQALERDIGVETSEPTIT
jgi:hypothetical protein